MNKNRIQGLTDHTIFCGLWELPDLCYFMLKYEGTASGFHASWIAIYVWEKGSPAYPCHSLCDYDPCFPCQMLHVLGVMTTYTFPGYFKCGPCQIWTRGKIESGDWFLRKYMRLLTWLGGVSQNRILVFCSTYLIPNPRMTYLILADFSFSYPCLLQIDIYYFHKLDNVN